MAYKWSSISCEGRHVTRYLPQILCGTGSVSFAYGKGKPHSLVYFLILKDTGNIAYMTQRDSCEGDIRISPLWNPDY